MFRPIGRTLLLLAFVSAPLSALSGTVARAMGSPDPPVATTLLRSSVIGSAGLPGSSASYRSAGTLAQSTPIGVAGSAEKVLSAGFWGIYPHILWPADVPLTQPFADVLLQNMPNPFRSSTTIVFVLSRSGPVRAEVFDPTGARVRTLCQGTRSPGWYRISWDGKDDHGKPVASGIYFCKYRTDAFQSVKKMLMLK
jgi:hypothetical protein